MNPWLEGAILTLTLAAGFSTGWFTFMKLRLRMPNVWVSALVLLAGSLGGPLLTYKLLGQGLWSYVLALLIAGASAGVTFWPMGQRQGEKQWL